MGHLVDPGLQDFQLNVHFSTAKTSNKIEILQKFSTPVYPPRMAPFGLKLWENTFQMIPNVSFSGTEKNDFFYKKNWYSKFCFQETGDLEEPDTFECHWQIRRKKLLPEVGLLLGRLPWRRGKRLNLCRKSWLSTENDFNRKKKIWSWLEDICVFARGHNMCLR